MSQEETAKETDWDAPPTYRQLEFHPHLPPAHRSHGICSRCWSCGDRCGEKTPEAENLAQLAAIEREAQRFVDDFGAALARVREVVVEFVVDEDRRAAHGYVCSTEPAAGQQEMWGNRFVVRLGPRTTGRHGRDDQMSSAQIERDFVLNVLHEIVHALVLAATCSSLDPEADKDNPRPWHCERAIDEAARRILAAREPEVLAWLRREPWWGKAVELLHDDSDD